jgi:hypothetical protein
MIILETVVGLKKDVAVLEIQLIVSLWWNDRTKRTKRKSLKILERKSSQKEKHWDEHWTFSH